MAKAKKQAPVIEEQKIEPEVITPETIPELIFDKEPIAVSAETVIAENVVILGEVPIEPIMAEEEKVRTEAIADPTTEDKILKYIENSTGNPVKLNDFLKSLFPPLASMEPPVWKQPIVSKQIKLMLTKMQNDGLIKLTNNLYSELGNCYFKGEEQRTSHYDLDSFIITAEK